MWEKFSIYDVHDPRNGIESKIKTPYSKRSHRFLLSHPRQREITHSPRQHFFENLFPRTAERGGGNYDLLYQNSIRRYEGDWEH